jgi:hypothetical protein
VCRKFVDAEKLANNKFKECKADEKTSPYTRVTSKAQELMIKRGVRFTRLQTFDQIKNGAVAKKWWQFWK